ncbi:hypothetical protein Cantr_08547 [Candida viswanathii]|uniref:Hyphally-regulated cell wall protein N-terminal domain-containing protein n=1 Tax=Candida viswanathii TaxID=5486 RepID=A0A367Y353_9ASCO|nr:hypothetical protein Cantr_08547 [Candida viswanathii]
MKTRSLVSSFLLATLSIAADVFKIKTSYKNTDFYLQVNSMTNEVVLTKEVGDDFRLLDDSHLVLSRDASIVIAHQDNDIVLTNPYSTEHAIPTWKINDDEIIYEEDLYACSYTTNIVSDDNEENVASYSSDEEEDQFVYGSDSYLVNQDGSNDIVISQTYKRAKQHIVQKRAERRDSSTVDASSPMIIKGLLDELVVFDVQDGFVTTVRKHDWQVLKFQIIEGHLKAGSKYIVIDDGDLVTSEIPEANGYWSLVDDQLWYGGTPEAVRFFSCENKINVDPLSGCTEVTSISIANYNFVPTENTVEPELPMLVTAMSLLEEIIISTTGSYVTVFDGHPLDAIKFTVVNGYLKAGDQYITENAGGLIVVTSTELAADKWVFSGDQLYFGDDPELVLLYSCEDRVFIQTGEGCDALTPVIFTNYNFEPQENTVDPGSPMAITGTIDGERVIVSTDGDEVVAFDGDLLDGTKFTIENRYLKAGDKYVDIDGGVLVLVETQAAASSEWILSGDHLFFGADPDLVHFYSCAGKIGVEDSGECEQLNPVVITNFHFVQTTNSVNAENPMLIKGELDGETVAISADGGFVTVSSGGDDVDATKFTIENRYLKADDKYVTADGGSLTVVDSEEGAERGWVLSGDQLYFGEDPVLVRFFGCAGKVSVDVGSGCDEVVLIVIKNFDFEPQENTIDPTEPMVVSGVLDLQDVVIVVVDDRITILEGELTVGARFKILEKYLRVGELYVGIDNARLVLVDDIDDAARGWILSGDQLYLGDDPALVILSVCEDGSVHVRAVECAILDEVTLWNVEDEPTTSSETESSTTEETDSETGSSTIEETDSEAGSSTTEATDSETETVSATEDPTDDSTDDPTPSETDADTDTNTETETETETKTETSSTTLAGPVPTQGPVDPLKPFMINVLYERQYLTFLTDGVHITLFEGDEALLKIDDGYLKVHEEKWISIADDGLLLLVDEKEDAAFGWRIEDGRLYYEITQRLLVRDTEEPVKFSVCDVDGDFFIFVGEIAGCELLNDVILKNHGASEDPTDPVSTEYESYDSEEPSETGAAGSSSSTSVQTESITPSDQTYTTTETSTASGSSSTTETTNTAQPGSTSDSTDPLSSSSTISTSGSHTGTTGADTNTGIATATVAATDTDTVTITTAADSKSSRHFPSSGTVLPGWRTAPGYDDETTLTTITDYTTITVTSCDDVTLCETSTEVRSTVYTTYCPATTTTAGDVLSERPKATVTVTVCSEGTKCEEVVSVIPSNESLHSSTIRHEANENPTSGDHGHTSVVESATTGFENMAMLVESSPIAAGLLVLLHLIL